MAGCRTLQQLTLPLAGLTLVCGANGCGKSNLYGSLGLIAAAALAAEGGAAGRFLRWAGAHICSHSWRVSISFRTHR